MLDRLSRQLTATSRRRQVAAFAPTTVLLALAVLVSVLYAQSRITRDRVTHAREAITAAERVLSDAKDAETGQRSYLLVGEEVYLDPYYAARVRVDSNLRSLERNALPEHAALIDSLHALIDARFAFADRTIRLRRAGDAAGALALVRSGTGRHYMDALRATAQQITALETRNLSRRLEVEGRYFELLASAFVAGTVFILILGFVHSRALLRFGTEQQAAAEKIGEQNRLLEEQAIEIEAQRDELQEQNIELELQQEQLARSNDELRGMNMDLAIAREDAERSNRAKSQFLASMSHELRTPLNAIGGYVDLIEAGVYGPVTDKQMEALRRVDANKSHLLTIINDILSYAGIAAGKVELIVQEFDLDAVILEVSESIEALASERQLTFQRELPSGGSRHIARADAIRTRQVLLNLLGNAIKFTPAGGAISLRCVENEEHVVVEVRDTGVGIPSEKIDAIFEPFVQLTRDRFEAAGEAGLGLGLAISRELARSMNGDILAQSIPGKGSLFSLMLPRAESVLSFESRSDSAILTRDQ